MLLVNIGFISIIVWGSSQIWLLGFALTVVYAIALLFCARYLESSRGTTTTNDEEEDDASSNTTTRASTGRLVSILYGLAVLSIGVSGSFLPTNLFGACAFARDDEYITSSYYNEEEEVQWELIINATEQPSALQAWDNESEQSESSTFAYLPKVNTTLFQGVVDNGDSVLWASVDGGKPQKYPTVSFPRLFVTVNDTVGCFLFNYTSVLGCYFGDRPEGDERLEESSLSDHDYFDEDIYTVTDLKVFGDDGLVWYKGCTPHVAKHFVASVDVRTGVQTLHSQKVTNQGDNDLGEAGDCSTQLKRVQSLCYLLATAVPVLLVSIFLWKKKEIPSMGFTSYIGFLAAYTIILTIISPDEIVFGSFPLAIGWVFFGIICCAGFLPLALFDRATPALRCVVYTAAAGFVAGLIILVSLLVSGGELLYMHTIIHFLSSMPMSILGAVTDSWWLTFLGAGLAFAALIFLVLYLTVVISVTNTLLIVFVTLAGGGLLIGFAGWRLGRSRSALKRKLMVLLTPLDKRLFGDVPEEAVVGVSGTPQRKSTTEEDADEQSSVTVEGQVVNEEDV